MSEHWYRYDDPFEAGKAPYLSQYEVLRRTPRGVVLDVWGVNKFVLADARKRYAYPTQELALDCYIIRKRWQMKHANNTLKRAEKNLAAAQAVSRGEVLPSDADFMLGPVALERG